MLEVKGVKKNFWMYSHHAMHTVLVTKIIYKDKSEFGEDRKISKFYRALVTGILDNDEVLYLSPYLFNTLF